MAGAQLLPARHKRGILCSFLSISIIFILFIFGMSVLAMQRYLVTYNYYKFHRGDVVSIRETVKDFSTQLCSGYEVDPFLIADVFLIPHKAAIDHVNRKISLNDYSDLYSGTRYKYQAMRLYAGSTISATGCKKQNDLSDVLVGIFVFKGDDSWKTWTYNQRCEKCVADSVTIQKNQLCDKGIRTKLEYSVTETATYYVAMARINPDDVYKMTYFEVSVKLNRTIFDVTKATQQCLKATNCSMALEYASDQDVVVDIPDDSILERDFGSHCEPRLMLWVGVFAIFPLTLILVLVGCCACCYMADRRDELQIVPPEIRAQNMYTVEDKAELVHNEHPSPGYIAVADSVQRS